MATQTPIVLFYHALFYFGNPPELWTPALEIAYEQINAFTASGLMENVSEFIVGINGGRESEAIAQLMLPSKAKLIFHGLDSKAENLTIVALEKWLQENHDKAYICYAHIKGATHLPGAVADMRRRWRLCMERHLIWEWRQAVADLDAGFESVGCHWMTPPKTPPGQFIWAGNFWWAKSDFLSTLPSIWKRARIIESGIGAAESRYEAEVWLGNGPRPPMVKDYHPDWDPSKVHTCHQ
jgi:hypothetical protein